MKKYIFKLIVFVASLCFPFICWFVYLFNIPDPFMASLPGTIHHKIDLLEDNADKQKLVFVGGSSSPYSMDCQKIEDYFKIETINVGTTAYVGLDFYFQFLENNLSSGDILVFAPENFLIYGIQPSYNLVWRSIGNDLSVLKNIPVSYYAGLYSESWNYYKDKKNALKTSSFDSYNSDFGEKGDVIIQRESLLESGWNTEDLVYIDKNKISNEVINTINSFVKKMQNNGVEVFYSYAPVNRFAIQTTDEQALEFETALNEKLGLNVVVSQMESIYDGKFFYDSNNHLTTLGAKIHTEKIIDGLQKIMGEK